MSSTQEVLHILRQHNRDLNQSRILVIPEPGRLVDQLLLPILLDRIGVGFTGGEEFFQNCSRVRGMAVEDVRPDELGSAPSSSKDLQD